MKFKILIAIALVLCLCPSVRGESWVRENFFLVDADLSGATYYLGYQSQKGGWYLKAIDTSTTDVKRFSYCYISENDNYSFHWTNRATLSGISRYRTFDEAF